MNKFADIRTLDELEEAIRAGKARAEREEKALGQHLSAVQSFYTPQNLMTEGVRRATHSLPAYGFVLTLISRLRKILSR